MFKKLASIIVIFLFVSTLIGIDSTDTNAAKGKQLMGKIALKAGKVYIGTTYIKNKKKRIRWRTAGKNSAIYLNEIVYAKPPKSRCHVYLIDGTQLTLKPKTKIVINAQRLKAGGKNKNFSVGIAYGAANVKKGRKSSKFSINTPSAQAGARGTEFMVAVSDTGDSSVMVYEGKVNVLDPNGKDTTVKAKEKGMVEVGSGGVDKEKLKEIPKAKKVGSYALRPTSKDESTFLKNGEKEAKKDPKGTLNKIEKALEKTKKDTKDTQKDAKSLQKDVKKDINSGKENISNNTANKAVRVDEEMALNSNRNEALYDLAKGIGKKNKSNKSIQKKVKKCKKVYEETWEVENELDAFIVSMEKEIDNFAKAQSKAIDDMVGNDPFFKDDDGEDW